MKQINDERLASALVRLQHDADGQLIIGWLKESLAEQDVKNRWATGDMFVIGQGQGRSQELQQIIESVENAAKGLADMQIAKVKATRPPTLDM